jgi:hypothetical protein
MKGQLIALFPAGVHGAALAWVRTGIKQSQNAITGKSTTNGTLKNA